MKAQATAAYVEKGLALSISKEGKSKKEMKAVKAKALEEEAPKAKMEVLQARNTKMLKELSINGDMLLVSQKAKVPT